MASLLTLGAGNMASALLSPMKDKVDDFFAYTPSGAKAQKLAQVMQGKSLELSELANIQKPDFLFLSFKPQGLQEACQQFLEVGVWENWKEHTTIISMLAGVPLELLEGIFDSKKVVRIMPNTPALVGEGITLVAPTKDMIENFQPELRALEELLETAGLVFRCESEQQLDDLTAVTGSGPAYIFEYTRILQNFLIQKGLDLEKARTLAVALLKGSSQMMTKTETDLETLRENVTSKNGVTFAALESLKGDHFEEVLVRALEKNISRSGELREAALKLK